MPPFSSQYGGNTDGLNINLSNSKPSFTSQFGGSDGTLNEQREQGAQTKGNTDVAGIIGASAGGLDSITNFITSVTGKGSSDSNTTYISPPTVENKPSPLLIGGIAAAVVLLIIVLILTKNGQAKQ